MHVPELRTASRRADLAAASQWREERRLLREEGELPALQLAVVTDGSDRALADRVRASGADIIGLLAPDALESLVWAAEAGADHGYSALDALAADAVEAACLDLPLGEASRVAGVLLADGLSVIFARPHIPDRATLRGLLDVAAAGNTVAVAALRTRSWPTAVEAARRLGEIGILKQVTVIGWPAGREARAELCDLIRRLCGDVLAVCGSAAAMPVRELSKTDPVTLALLTATGATVVASESSLYRYEDAQVTFVGTGGRIVLGLDEMRIALPTGVSTVAGLGGTAHPVQTATEGLRDELAGAPSGAAGLGDLLATARLVELAAESYERDAWIEV